MYYTGDKYNQGFNAFFCFKFRSKDSLSKIFQKFKIHTFFRNVYGCFYIRKHKLTYYYYYYSCFFFNQYYPDGNDTL